MASSIRISELSISEVLENLSSRKWKVPRFQREFVWDTSAVAGLATSVIDGYPIGMVTLWEQPSDSHIELEPLSIDDWDSQTKAKVVLEFGKPEANPTQVMAILDGRQRSTALAMAFSGFAPKFGGNKYSGRYFLNASLKDPLERVVFKKKVEIQREGLTNLEACIAKGYFPLASFDKDQSLLQQWYGYIQKLKDETIYPEGEFPDQEEIARRDKILQQAFEGITETKLGACTVPQRYDLGQICEIFETLNLTGMKVSTVDLINSWLLRDTNDQLHLREWMDDLSQLDGTIGWAMPKKRPELIAQISTACFVALNDLPTKPKARRVAGSSKPKAITSVKSSDLLATPVDHWIHLVDHTDEFSQFIGDFQKVVADGSFGYLQCPYPISSGIYVGLRWHKRFDPESTHGSWSVDDLNVIFRAFFWRNALATRYDQGFLSQMGTDMNLLKSILGSKGNFTNRAEWTEFAEEKISREVPHSEVRSHEQLVELLLNGRPGGALQSALLLPMIASASTDFMGHLLSGEDGSRVELHHIYPKRWCRENAAGDYLSLLGKDSVSEDFVDSISNLMPISREVNNLWKSKSPATFLQEKGITYEGDVKSSFEKVFIDEECFNLLKGGMSSIEAFWRRRANLIADRLVELTEIS
ncbi:DUF262 domain-containing protein [Mameliella alba]|uniref:DUF262 domain-containing protein n=1 Tax=Mameliella alba TaxID=561184 RepID=UPI001C983239|nr:DUF262 domain-containing protein [Mameliella alba]MBY6122537.1 DUF262 domain-containing protein [Mameliella alba]